jgi:hypothetical protein
VLIPVANLVLLAVVLSGLLMAPWGGLRAVLAAAAGIAALITLRAIRMTVKGGLRGLRDAPANFVVAAVYEMARALALVARASHRVRRERGER